MARRANGEGTIRKRSDGRWEGRYYNPIADKQQSVYGKTQKEVREKLSKVAVDKDIKQFVSKTDLTVDEWFEYYINNYKKGYIKPQSVSCIQSGYYNHIKPCIGDKPIYDVTRDDIRNLYKTASQTCNYGTMTSIKSHLSGIFSYALEDKKIRYNPVTGVELPSNNNPSYPKGELLEMQLYWFFRGVKEFRNTDMLYFLLLFTTGMRKNEAIALKWQDIDRDFKIITIRTTAVQYYDFENGCTVKTENFPKSCSRKRSSVRTVPIQEDVAALLRQEKATAEFVAKQFNRPFGDENDIFIKYKDGQRYDPRHFTQSIDAIKKYLRQEYNIELGKLTPHFFRHTFASQGVRCGVSLEALRSILGHANYQMLLRYAHCNNADREQAVKTMF